MNRILIASLVFATSLAAQKVPNVETPVPVKDGRPIPVDPGKQVGAINPSAKGNSWFPVVEQDLGTYLNHEEAKGSFKFKNPSDKAVEWKYVQGSCTCSRAVIKVADRTYEMNPKPENALYRIAKRADGSAEKERVQLIQVNAGEEGEVEVHMEMNGVSGSKQSSLDIHMTDPDLPLVKLKFQATGAQMFTVTPTEFNLNTMTWNETRDFTVTVTSPIQSDFNITRMDELPKDFHAKYEKMMKDGVATWTVSGTYGPLSSESGGGGVLKFYTDMKDNASFTVRVIAFVKGPLEVKPGGFVTLGMVRRGAKKTEKITFEPNDGTNLEAKSIRFEQLSVPPQFVSATPTKDGNKLIVEIEIAADVPTGLLRGDMVVELNHPSMKEKRIMFNGFVR